MSFISALGMAAALGLLYLVVCIFRIMTSDADLRTLKASRKYTGREYRDKVVWIIGASSGIGACMAEQIARSGAHLILSARREEQLQAVAKKCKAEGAASVNVELCDVLATATHADVVKRVIRYHGRIDVLVQNAGRSQRALVDDADYEVDVEMFNLNVLGVMSLTKAALPAIIAAKGRILVTSSVAGIVPSPCSSTYSATKHAIQGFFHTLRSELAYRGVSVTLGCPGPVLTEGQSNAFTGKKGQTVGQQDLQSKRLTPQRCAHLMIAACAAGLPESWMAPQPVLLMCYIVQYLPTLGEWAAARVGAKRVKAFKAGDMGYKAVSGSVWKTLFGKDDE